MTFYHNRFINEWARKIFINVPKGRKDRDEEEFAILVKGVYLGNNFTRNLKTN